MKTSKKDLISALRCFVLGAICLVLGGKHGFKTLDLVAAGLSFFTGVICLFDYWRARYFDNESGKGSPD